ncbi:hypothetical protein QZH41_015397 [Actinostola sp. cb2023]|nr:hypothetical protein QZH41_015397 [Actinostola sp. cb2023]
MTMSVGITSTTKAVLPGHLQILLRMRMTSSIILWALCQPFVYESVHLNGKTGFV